MAQARSARNKRWEKNEDPYSTDQDNEVSKDIYFFSNVCLTGSGTIFIHAERLQISEAPRKLNESTWNRRLVTLKTDVYKTWTVVHASAHGPGPWTTMDHPMDLVHGPGPMDHP